MIKMIFEGGCGVKRINLIGFIVIIMVTLFALPCFAANGNEGEQTIEEQVQERLEWITDSEHGAENELSDKEKSYDETVEAMQAEYEERVAEIQTNNEEQLSQRRATRSFQNTVVFIIIAVGIVLCIAIVVFILKDAPRRDLTRLWAIVGVIHIIGLIIYLCIRNAHPVLSKYQNCGIEEITNHAEAHDGDKI